MKDTGWWAINEAFIDRIIWGKNEGFKFLEGDCDDFFIEMNKGKFGELKFMQGGK